MNKHVEEILKLSKQEQQDAYAEIGSNLLSHIDFRLSKEKDDEIRRRIEMIENGDLTFSTWDEVKQRIKAK